MLIGIVMDSCLYIIWGVGRGMLYSSRVGG